jgi:hypothetical protein
MIRAVTVSGATDEEIAAPTANGPSLLRASALDTLLSPRGTEGADTVDLLLQK